MAWVTREEKPVILGRFWRPEPDVAIVRGPKDFYRQRDPETSDVVLLFEVADSSYGIDRGQKWHAYAAARIPVYWIVNLEKGRIEVCTDPIGRGKKARFPESVIFGIDAEVSYNIDGQDVGRVAVQGHPPLTPALGAIEIEDTLWTRLRSKSLPSVGPA